MFKWYIVFLLFSLNLGMMAKEFYDCEVLHIDHESETSKIIKSESTRLKFGDFKKECKSGACNKHLWVPGITQEDGFVFNIIAHNAKPPTVSVMLMVFDVREGEAKGYTLAGTDYGNRLYSQVEVSDSKSIFVECKYGEVNSEENKKQETLRI